jgi:hypothetical protein
MTNHDNKADDIAHERFKSDFDKLFGTAPTLRKTRPAADGKLRERVAKLFPTEALRKEYLGADEGSRITMLMELVTEQIAAPHRRERQAALAKVMQEREGLQGQAAALIGQVADLQSAVAKLKSVAANSCEVRRRMSNDRTSELAKMVDEAIDVFKNTPALLAMARLGGGADACEKLVQSSGPAAADLPAFTKH